MDVDEREPAGTDASSPAWGWAEVVACLVAAYIGSGVVFGVYAAVRSLPAGTEPSSLALGAQVLFAVPLWLGFLAAPILILRRLGVDPRVGLGLVQRRTDILLGLLVGALCQFPGVPIVSWPLIRFTDVSFEEIEARAEMLADRATGVGGVLLLVLMVVVMAPLAEEVFFRGFLQPRIAAIRGVTPIAASLATALVFALTHFEPVQIPALFAFGVVLSELARRFGRLGPAIWAHVGFNLTTVVILLT